MDLHGKPFEQIETGYIARIWQHEVDHLNGVLITDRMGPVAKMAHRKILRELEEKYAEEHPAPPPPRSSPSKKKKSRS
jgi:peptide deformylase